MLHTEKKKYFPLLHCLFLFSKRSQTCTQKRTDIEEKDFVTSKVTLVYWREHHENKAFMLKALSKTEKNLLTKLHPAKLVSYVIYTNTVFSVPLRYSGFDLFSLSFCHRYSICAEYQWYLLYRQSTKKKITLNVLLKENNKKTQKPLRQNTHFFT